jgi:GNAT superfamily N-acetyltransferase
LSYSPSDVDFRPITNFTTATIKTFDSGNTGMTEYFHRFAKKNHKTGLSPCTVIVPLGAHAPILGYVTISNSTVEKGEPPAPQLSFFPNYPIPVTLIGRLAIHKSYHGMGLGRFLLMHVFFTSAQAVRGLRLGSVGIITDAIDQNAVDFYEKYGFQMLPGQKEFPQRLFIPNAVIFDAIEG